ncbi:uncharacterized protein LOC115325083 [Ixodes scapularis]|uniref:uncharacterized protein LOC115325083 n=1 Tax=Ixodes scapularis TaxID=6945 RepID=UPI001A9E0625|nr:uncharacterized protein LOC115325083 [Ixodes scapularis]
MASSSRNLRQLAASLPYQDIKPVVRASIFQRWQTEWDEESNNKLHFTKPILGLWESASLKNRFHEPSALAATSATSARTRPLHGFRSGMPCSRGSAKDAPVPALAAASLRSPAPFSFHDAGEWLPWLQQFEDYAFATGMHVAPDEARIRTLLYCMGPRARIVLSSLMSDEEAYQSSAEVTRRLSSYFVHPINETYESSRFYKRTQQPGETVDSFFTALRNMVC